MTSILRGTDGSQDVAVTPRQRNRPPGQEPAKPGKDLRLTIDLDIQRAAENALERPYRRSHCHGSAHRRDTRPGSRPTFDPNEFAVRISHAEWQPLITDPDHPLMNKAIQAQLAPGSTFKIIMSLAGLQENVAQNIQSGVHRRRHVVRPLLRL